MVIIQLYMCFWQTPFYTLQIPSNTPKWLPKSSSYEALIKIPASLDSKSLQLLVINMSGKQEDVLNIPGSTGWTKLNASNYPNGVYLIEILSGNRIVAQERWVVNH